MKLYFPLEVLLCCAVLYVLTELYSWYKHWKLADAIADWCKKDLRKARRQLGIKFRRTPCPPSLVALSCKLLVLSAIMLSMATVASAGHVSLLSPVSWVETIG